MSGIRISFRHSDWGCLYIAIGMIVSTGILSYSILSFKVTIDPAIEKLSQETDEVLEKAIVRTSQETEKVLKKAISQTSHEAEQLINTTAEEVPKVVENSINRINNPAWAESTKIKLGDSPVTGVYSIKKGDPVYFRVAVKNSNPIVSPYFYFYRMEGKKKKKIDETSSIKGTRLSSTRVLEPSKLSWKISEKDLQETGRYCIDALASTGKNCVLVNGKSYSADKFKKWLRCKPKETLTLNFYPGCTVTLRYAGKKGQDYIVQIVKYNIPVKSVNSKILARFNGNIKIEVLDSSRQIIPRQENGEYLLRGFNSYIVRVYEGKTSRTFKLNNLFTRVNTHFKNSGKPGRVYFPFMYPSSGIKLYVTFEGIRRTYMVNHVTIPANTDERSIPTVSVSLLGGKIKTYNPSQLTIRILRNGRFYYSTVSEEDGWDIDFNRNKNNRFSIREGVGHSYTTQIIHKETGDILTEFPKLTDLHFHGKITENSNQKRWPLLFPGTISMEFKLVK